MNPTELKKRHQRLPLGLEAHMRTNCAVLYVNSFLLYYK